ncbi:MAG: hypothetical protein LBE59_02745 [Nevskiaceae bacterium]|jgi:hypothetical protein|nr:hypothetical protein [Nevskiaceae bacterium]
MNAKDAKEIAGSFAGSACEVSKPQPGISEPTLVLRNLIPKPGEAMNRETVLAASLAYQVPEDEQWRYQVRVQFETTTGRGTRGGAFFRKTGGQLVEDHGLICGPAGIISIVLPMVHIWADPDIRHPLGMYFYLVRNKDGDRAQRVVAKVGPFNYGTMR